MKSQGVERATVARDGTLVAMVETGKSDEPVLKDSLKRANIECRAKP
jgi:hypothetical protein